MQVDPDKHWHRKPFATRLTGNGDGDGDDRVWLNHDAFKLRRNGVVEERPVERDEWDALLDEWFAMRRPGPWPE